MLQKVYLALYSVSAAVDSVSSAEEHLILLQILFQVLQRVNLVL